MLLELEHEARVAIERAERHASTIPYREILLFKEQETRRHEHEESCAYCRRQRARKLGRYRKVDTRVWNDAKFKRSITAREACLLFRAEPIQT